MTNPEQLLAALTEHAVRLGQAGAAPLKQVRIQSGDVVVEAVWDAVAPNGHVQVPASPEKADAAADAGQAFPEGTFTICAPTVGTYYAAPEPNAKPFVAVGDMVVEGQQVAILEAMKLMSPIEADRAGRVVEVLVDNATPVEYGQPLFLLEPC